MASAIIYLDESGDLGWSFNAPYLQGGSSRFLTIAAIVVPSEKGHLPKRLIKDLYQSRNWSTAAEKKWSDMGPEARLEFANRAAALRAGHQDVTYHSITVRKENVLPHIRNDPNKLYNFMIKTSLLDVMAAYEVVHMIPDPRSIKVKSGNSLHDYLQGELWFTKNVQTVLRTTPIDSAKCRGLQFTDMISGVVSSYYEKNQSAPWNVLNPHVVGKRLFF